MRLSKLNAFLTMVALSSLILIPGGMSLTANAAINCCQVAGDANHDGSTNIADVTFMIARIFLGASLHNARKNRMRMLMAL